jgi:hypothetical protein
MATKATEKKTAQENIEQASGVTPEAELKAAVDEPAGSTVFSGASAGIKATATDESAVFEPTKAQVAAEKQAMKVADEVRELQEDVQRKNLLSNVPEYPIAVAYANRPEKGTPDSMTFSVTGGELIVTTTSNTMRFGTEEAAGLQRAAAKVAGAL